MSRPLTLGTAGHIDHGKTSLVAALTGVDTDRLPEERSRGMTIELGFAPLTLPSGRRLSVVDVPGHERFVRTMVAGASGIDLFLMVIAADDGVMPQTKEHASVLEGLGVTRGVVAVTKADLIDPELALLEANELLPDTPAIAVSARTGEGLDELRSTLDDLADQIPSRADAEGPTRLHVDRVFTIRGAGTVVTGTLWAGTIGRGDELMILPQGIRARVRGVQVHDQPQDRADAGQRVAVNLVGLEVRDVQRGDVLTTPGTALRPTYILDAALDARIDHGTRIHVHHGTREVPARTAALGGRYHQLRLEKPLIPARGDRIVVRSIAPPDTLGGGTILDATTKRHGATRDALARLTRLEKGEPDPAPDDREGGRRVSPADGTGRGRASDGAAAGGEGSAGESPPAPLPPEALHLAAQLQRAGTEPPLDSELGDQQRHLEALRNAGQAVRVGRSLHFHPDALVHIRETVEHVIEEEGQITLARLRDELGTSRKFAQALLEHFDNQKVTLRRPDDSRVLRRRRQPAR